jgi:GNAT superfamily N-acetyltransferase
MTSSLDQAPPLDVAVANAAAFWTLLAQTRGHRLTTRPGFVCVHGSERSGMRIVLRTGTPDAEDVAELTKLAENAARVVVEDAYGTVDLSSLGLKPRELPVMARTATASTVDTQDVVRADTPEQLATVENVVVHGFPLERHQPYRRGEVFPPALLDRDDVELYLTERDGEPAGACFVVLDGTAAGLYWVTTLPAKRSRGVGRSLMNAMLSRLDGLPVTLTASKAGKPLYDSLGFSTLASSIWWA